MSDYEKGILCLMLMRDIRGNWGNLVMERAEKVRDLAEDLGWEKTLNLANEFIAEPEDGRHFRTSFEHGGYEKSDLQTCSKDFWSYSIEFQKEAMSYLTYPKFDGWACS